MNTLDLAARLIGNQSRESSQGSIQSRIHVGLWPIQSDTHPETAMGIAAVLAYLLERWRTIRVYRLFYRAEDASLAEGYHPSIADSQFGIDDWLIDDLDENIALWGNLTVANGQYKLILEAENDLIGDDEPVRVFELDAATLTDLIAALPNQVEAIAEYVGAGEVSIFYPAYTPDKWNENDLVDLLTAVFYWERGILFDLFGKTQTEEGRESICTRLLDAAEKLEGDLGGWIGGSALARPLLPYYPLESDYLPLIEAQLDCFENTSIYGLFVAVVFFRAGYSDKAFTLLETEADLHPTSSVVWLVLGELYRQKQDYSGALETFQRGIAAGGASTSLYMRYADLLLALDASNVSLNLGARRSSLVGREFVETLMLIDESERRSANHLIREAVAAYQAALVIEPTNQDVLTQLLINQVEQIGKVNWELFRQLVAIDESGDDVRAVTEGFYNIDDLSPAIKILDRISSERPSRVDLLVNLASIYLIDEQVDEVIEVLEQAQEHPDAATYRPEIERLLLAADDPEFEMRLGEISDLVNAGANLKADDLEFLEIALESATHIPSLYVLLSSGYLSDDETDNALEVILDGQKNLPDDPEIALALAKALWKANERQLALDTLKKGITKSPTHVPMLALMGRYLFDEDQDEEARNYLRKAEGFNPLDSSLNEVRRYIASQMGDS